MKLLYIFYKKKTDLHLFPVEIRNIPLWFEGDVYRRSFVIIHRNDEKTYINQTFEFFNLKLFIRYNMLVILLPIDKKEFIYSPETGLKGTIEHNVINEFFEKNGINSLLVQNKIELDETQNMAGDLYDIDVKKIITNERIFPKMKRKVLKEIHINDDELAVSSENISKEEHTMDSVISYIKAKRSQLYELEEKIVTKFINEKNILPFKKETVLKDLFSITKNNHSIIKYIEYLRQGLSEGHDLNNQDIFQILVFDFDERIVLFFQKIVFNETGFFLILENPDQYQTMELVQLQSILDECGLTPKVELGISDQLLSQIMKGNYNKKLSLMTEKQDELNLIHMAQFSHRPTKSINNFSKSLMHAEFWSYASKLYLYNMPKENYSSIFIKTSKNILKISHTFFPSTNNNQKKSLLYLLNTACMSPDDYNNLYDSILGTLKNKARE